MPPNTASIFLPTLAKPAAPNKSKMPSTSFTPNASATASPPSAPPSSNPSFPLLPANPSSSNSLQFPLNPESANAAAPPVAQDQSVFHVAQPNCIDSLATLRLNCSTTKRRLALFQ